MKERARLEKVSGLSENDSTTLPDLGVMFAEFRFWQCRECLDKLSEFLRYKFELKDNKYFTFIIFFGYL